MAHFVYTAEKSDGEIYKGVAEAADRFEVYNLIRREGGKIISLESAGKASWLSLTFWNLLLTRISEYEKILFARNLGAMLGAGLSLARALAVIERQTKNIKMAEVISEVASDVRRGDTFHASLAKHPRAFSKLFVAMVRAGEEGGDLSSALGVTSDQMERMYTLKKKIRGALIYPAVVLVAIFGIGALMMVEVVPTLAQTFKEMKAELPSSTTLIINISSFLVHYTLVSVIVFASAIAAFIFAARTPAGRRGMDFFFLHVPVIGAMVREVNAARTARTLASLLSSGVDMLAALEIVGEVVQNSYFKEVLNDASRGVRGGEPLSAAFVRRDDLYPSFVGEMMSVGEETGQVADMMKRLALFYEDEVDRKTKDMSTIIEPFLMLFIGGAVGFFAIAMISPIYQLSENI